MELFLEQIELKDNTLNDNTFDIFFDVETGLIHAIENDVPKDEAREFVYRLVDDQDKIASEHRDEILAYCLSKVLPSDEVGLGDIFMHGKYIERVYMNWTVEKKDEIERILINKWACIGMDIPRNYEDIVQDCYEDVCETADPINWHSGDVAIAFRRWIESKGKNKGE
jgi:hypothetical protein